jgi:two-component system phosphate regulon response regulator PhoB
MDELTAAKGPAQDHLIVVGEFLLDRETIRVWRGSKPLKLSMRQFRLLDVFMRHPGEPISRQTLKELVWGIDATIQPATVDAEIVRLRRAIGGRKSSSPIRTIRSLGYAFTAPKKRGASKRASRPARRRNSNDKSKAGTSP